MLISSLADLREHCLDDAGSLVADLNDVPESKKYSLSPLTSYLTEGLPGREEEPELAGVGQLHGVAVLDVGSPLGPVVRPPRGWVQHLGCRADLITHTVVEPPHCIVGNVAHSLEVLPVPGVQLVVAPGIEQVLPVAVEGEIELEVCLSAQEEVLDGLRLWLREGARSSECFLARIITGPVSSPVVAKVPVEVNTLTLLGDREKINL